MAVSRLSKQALQSAFESLFKSHGSEEVLCELIRFDVDPCVRDNEALCISADLGYDSLSMLLMDHSKVDVAAQNNQPLANAIREGSQQIVDTLLSKEKVLNGNLERPMIAAIDRGQSEMVQFFLERISPPRLMIMRQSDVLV